MENELAVPGDGYRYPTDADLKWLPLDNESSPLRSTKDSNAGRR
ncbi:hypothetical protein [Rubripirellula tenax]|nr:hypothetical protein [Rubripirellula tenax]